MGDSPQDSTDPRRPASELGPGTLPVPPAADPLFVGISAICDTVVRLTGVDGAAVAVLAPSMGVRELVYATDALAQQLDELQFTLGEGPCVDAYQRGQVGLAASAASHLGAVIQFDDLIVAEANAG